MLPPAQPIVFFDDSQSVVDAANEFGWSAYQYDSIEDLSKSPLLKSHL